MAVLLRTEEICIISDAEDFKSGRAGYIFLDMKKIPIDLQKMEHLALSLEEAAVIIRDLKHDVAQYIDDTPDHYEEDVIAEYMDSR